MLDRNARNHSAKDTPGRLVEGRPRCARTAADSSFRSAAPRRVTTFGTDPSSTRQRGCATSVRRAARRGTRATMPSATPRAVAGKGNADPYGTFAYDAAIG